jgi:hypothetical protein
VNHAYVTVATFPGIVVAQDLLTPAGLQATRFGTIKAKVVCKSELA